MQNNCFGYKLRMLSFLEFDFKINGLYIIIDAYIPALNQVHVIHT